MTRRYRRRKRWKDALTRRVLREVAGRDPVTGKDRGELVAAHLERGESALAEGRFADAARCFQEALNEGCQDEELPGRIAETLEQARRGDDDERVAAVVRRLTSPSPEPGAETVDTTAYFAYLSLPARLREQARRQLDDPRLESLERTIAAESFSEAKAQSLVAAVLAVERARARVREEPSAVLDELEAHRSFLGGSDEARRLADEARARLAAAKRKAAVVTLAVAEANLSAGTIEAARQVLDTLVHTDLDPAGAQQAKTLRERLDYAETMQRLQREAALCEAAGDLFQALERTRQLLEMAADDDARRQWRGRSEALEARLRESWRLEVVEEPEPVAELHDLRVSPDDAPKTPLCLDDAGQELVLVSVWGAELFVRVVDVTSRRVRRSLALRLPWALEKLDWLRDGDRLLLVGIPGVYFELDLKNGRILTWRPLDEAFASDSRVWEAMLLPGRRHLWLRLSGGKFDTWVVVVDINTLQIVERFPDGGWFSALCGTEVTRVALDDGTGVWICNEVATRQQAGIPGKILSHIGVAISGPPHNEALLSVIDGSQKVDSEHYVRFPKEDDEDEEDDEMSWELTLILGRFVASTDGKRLKCVSALRLCGEGDRVCGLVGDLSSERVFVLPDPVGEERNLFAIDVSPPHLAPIYRARVPARTWLFQDPRSRHAVLLARCGGRLELHRLGGEPPDLGEVPELPWAWTELPQVSPPFHSAGSSSGISDQLYRRISRLSDLEAGQFLRQLVAAGAGAEEPAAVLAWLRAYGRRRGAFEGLVRELGERYPDDDRVLLLQAEDLANAECWSDARPFLERIDISKIDSDRRCYARQLLGLSRLFTGETEKARAVFQEAVEEEPWRGSMTSFHHLTEPMEDPPRPEEWDSTQPFVCQLLGAIRTADAALSAGDVEAARQAIDRPIVWQTEELQSVARLASVYLDTVAASPRDRFRKRLALACFLYVWNPERYERYELPLPELRWDASRLEDLAERSSRWLGGEREGESGP